MGVFRSGERLALGFLDGWLLRVAHLLAVLALVLWYASLTVLQPGRVDALVDTVLTSAHVQRETANEIYSQVQQLAPGTPMSKQTARAITKAMGNDPKLREMLAGYAAGGPHPIGAVNGRDIDPKQVDAAFHAAAQQVDPELAQALRPVHLHVTPAGLSFTADTIPSYADANTIAKHAWPWLALLAVLLWILAWAFSQQRAEVLTRLGRWLITVALVQVAVVVVGPRIALHFVDAAWASKYAAAAVLWGSRVTVPIVVMGVIGAGLVLLARVTTRDSAGRADPAPA